MLSLSTTSFFIANLEPMTSYRSFLILIILSLTAGGLYGQMQKISGTIVINGVKSSGYQIKVTEADIRNMKKKISTRPDNLGNFYIDAQIGDSLEVYLRGFSKKYVIIGSHDHMTVYLDNTILLEEVDINAAINNKTFLKKTAVDYNKQNNIYFGGKPPITLLSPFGGSPITFFRELLGKDGEKVRRFNKYINQQIELEEVDAKFNTQTIKQVVAINDYEINAFKAAYRPTIEDIKKWTNYELYDYIKQSYEDFKKSK